MYICCILNHIYLCKICWSQLVKPCYTHKLTQRYTYMMNQLIIVQCLTSQILETDICTIVSFSFIYYKHGFLIGKIRIIITYCKTQNSGLRSKEEKPRDPINQPSRCNTQEGLLSVAQTGDWSPGRQSTPNSKLGKLFICKKKHTISIVHTGYKVIGYTFAKQSYWYKLRRLHVYKAILLVQTARAFVQT